jgi:hypothetical protein
MNFNVKTPGTMRPRKPSQKNGSSVPLSDSNLGCCCCPDPLRSCVCWRLPKLVGRTSPLCPVVAKAAMSLPSHLHLDGACFPLGSWEVRLHAEPGYLGYR